MHTQQNDAIIPKQKIYVYIDPQMHIQRETCYLH